MVWPTGGCSLHKLQRFRPALGVWERLADSDRENKLKAELYDEVRHESKCQLQRSCLPEQGHAFGGLALKGVPD